ncbi:MAG TPA: hypothetical protein VMR41_02805 [Patescibacteria group bacterium]|nr:hypothetical protein [Patescibacteria group bacterium]
MPVFAHPFDIPLITTEQPFGKAKGLDFLNIPEDGDKTATFADAVAKSSALYTGIGKTLKKADLGSNTLYYLKEGDPDVIIREERGLSGRSIERTIETYRAHRTIIDRLAELGVSSVPYELRVYPSTFANSVEAYTVTKKVSGVNIFDAQFSEEEAPQAALMVDTFLKGLVGYNADYFHNRGFVKFDLIHVQDFAGNSYHNTQFIYGTLGDDTQKKIYLVDVESKIENIWRKDEQERLIVNNINRLGQMIFLMEQVLHGQRLEGARATLVELTHQIPETFQRYLDVAAIKQAFEDGTSSSK